jgi:heat shock protein HtpX
VVGRNGLRTLFLLVLLTGVLLVVGQLVGGIVGLAFAAVFAVGLNFFSYWKSDTIVLKSMRAREVSERAAPRLHRIVERAAVEAGIPKPKVYIMDTPSPNAFATGRSPSKAAVAATSGIMSLLTERELAGVFAHELAHVKNRDTLINTIVAMIASTIMIIAMFARWSLFFGMMFGAGRSGRGSDQMAQLAGTIVLAIVAPLVAALIQMAVSRSREYGADEMGARNSRDPEALASALTKLHMAAQQQPMTGVAGAEMANHLFIVNPLAGGPGRWFASHPKTEDRVDRLRVIGREIGQIF